MELILDLTGWRISSTKIMSSNIIFPLPKESDNTSEKFRKTSGNLDDIKKTLVFTTEIVIKERNNDMVDKKSKTKPNMVKEAIILFQKKIETVNKTEKSQAPNKTVDTHRSNKTEKVKSMDK